MSMDSFYVVLPSNAEEGNTPSKFLTTLQNPINIEQPEEWEVGLIEFNFKNALKTIYNDKIKVIKRSVPYPEKRVDVELISIDPLNWHAHTFNTKLMDEYDRPMDIVWGILVPQKGEAGRIIFKSENTDTPKVYFECKDQKIIIVNTSKQDVEVTIPEYWAAVMGFKERKEDAMVRGRIGEVDARTRINRLAKYTIKNLKPGRNISPYEIVSWVYKNKRYMVTFLQGTSDVTLRCDIEYIPTPKVTFTTVTISPKPGRYLKAQELAEEFVDVEFNKYFKLEFNERENIFKITGVIKDDELNKHKIVFEGGIHEVLGFAETEYTNEEIGDGKQADLQVDLERGITNIFIYCDLCQQIRVGNTTAPLLRPIAFNAHKYGDMVHTHFINPMYVPINKSFIDTIEVKICDATGEPIGFVEGLTTIVLHFKRA